MIKLPAYSILTFSLFLVVFSPTYFQLVGSYAVPTATYAYMLTSTIKVYNETDYWSYALMVEVEYPAPSIFLGVYSEILGLPLSLRIFQPVMGLASLVYFVFVLKVMILERMKREHALLLSAIYHLFIITSQLHAYYVGRATFGVIALVYLFLVLLIHIGHYKREGLIALSLLTALLGFTYYTSALSVMLIGVFSYPLIKLINSSGHKYFNPCRGLFILSLLVIVLTIMHSASTFTLLADTSPVKFYDNLIEYIKAQLKIERTSEAYYLHVGLSGGTDLVVRVTQLWLRTFINLSAAATLSLLFLREVVKSLIRRKTNMNHLTVYIVIAFISSCSELAYTFAAPTFSLRFFTMFGLPILIYIAYSVAASKTPSNTTWNSARGVISAITLGLLLVVGVTSTFTIQQGEVGHVKLYNYEKVQGLVTYLTAGSSLGRTVIATDAGYSAILYYLLRIANSNIVTEPLGPTSVTLYYTCNNASLYYSNFVYQLRSQWLLLIRNETIFGDPWGYAVKIHKCELISMLDLIYSDSRLILIT